MVKITIVNNTARLRTSRATLRCLWWECKLVQLLEIRVAFLPNWKPHVMGRILSQGRSRQRGTRTSDRTRTRECSRQRYRPRPKPRAARCPSVVGGVTAPCRAAPAPQERVGTQVNTTDPGLVVGRRTQACTPCATAGVQTLRPAGGLCAAAGEDRGAGVEGRVVTGSCQRGCLLTWLQPPRGCPWQRPSCCTCMVCAKGLQGGSKTKT